MNASNLENIDQAFYNSEILIAEENPFCDRWGDWNTVYAAGEELQPRQAKTADSGVWKFYDSVLF